MLRTSIHSGFLILRSGVSHVIYRLLLALSLQCHAFCPGSHGVFAQARSDTSVSDYMHLTRLPAHLAAALFPLQTFLLLPLPLPLPALLPQPPSRPTLIPYHRALGAVLLFLLAVHATLCLSFFAAMGALGKRLGDADVQIGLSLTGVAAGTGWWAMRGAAGVKGGRDAWVWGHLLGVSVMIAGLWFHVRWARAYVVEAGLLLGWAVLRRLDGSRNLKAG